MVYLVAAASLTRSMAGSHEFSKILQPSGRLSVFKLGGGGEAGL